MSEKHTAEELIEFLDELIVGLNKDEWMDLTASGEAKLTEIKEILEQQSQPEKPRVTRGIVRKIMTWCAVSGGTLEECLEMLKSMGVKVTSR